MSDLFDGKESVHAPATYRDMCVPFESVAKANESFQAFQNELYDLRVKYRVRDLLYVATMAIKYDDGNEGTPTLVGHFGDENMMEGMAGIAFGRASAERQERIAKITHDASDAVRAPKRRK